MAGQYYKENAFPFMYKVKLVRRKERQCLKYFKWKQHFELENGFTLNSSSPVQHHRIEE